MNKENIISDKYIKLNKNSKKIQKSDCPKNYIISLKSFSEKGCLLICPLNDLKIESLKNDNSVHLLTFINTSSNKLALGKCGCT